MPISDVVEAIKAFLPTRWPWRRSARIDGTETLFTFVASRAAFVTQKKLYGYLKTRMGLKFPQMFGDEAFATSISLATRHIFAASLADLTLFCVARAMAGDAFTNADREALAAACYDHGIIVNDDGSVGTDIVAAWRRDFTDKLPKVNWCAEDAAFFTSSPNALIRWAPIADELKRHDADIVRSSIRHAWIEIRHDYLQLLDRDPMATAVKAFLAER